MGLNLTLTKLPDDDLHNQGSHTPSNTSDGSGKNTTINNEFDTIVLPVLYLIIFVASILLNGLAVWIFFHIRNKTSFIFYLKNIVVADLIMTLTFPFRIVHDAGFGPWSFSRRLFKKSNIRTRSESIRSLQSVRRSEVRIYYDYTDV
ncbi:G-protein coupled receptor 87 isoform X3 [Manis javanica]|uniref:G-protein coupled receptor 87 isoform X3 n=1 Tax=Manis javanica TaxID=9974 RepID=UPI003C6D28EC|nr:G-protein coupled receptor 87 [Manis javanica]